MRHEQQRRALQLQLLRESLDAIRRSADALRHSLGKCDRIDVRSDYNLDELESFEALSGRFARTSDLYTQQLLKGLLMLLGEDPIAFLDKARMAEKLGIIHSTEELVAIRDLRNMITHEYAQENLSELFQRIRTLSRTLLTTIDSTAQYIQTKFFES